MQDQTLSALSESLVALVDSIRPSLFAVEGARAPATATHLRDDLAVTVAHVMGQSREGFVRGVDGLAHRAEILGVDPGLDLCLLRVEGINVSGDAPAPRWRDDDTSLSVGSLLAVLGTWSRHDSHFARGGRRLWRHRHGAESEQVEGTPPVQVSANLGVLSRSGGPWRAHSGAQLDALLEIDTVLHRAAAGGPAVTPGGEIVGMNTFALRRGGTTIPAKTIRSAVDNIIAGTVARPGRLGVGVQAVRLHGDQANIAGTEVALLLTSIAPPSAAHRAGLGVGDVLLRFEGEPLLEVRDLQRKLMRAGGQSIKLDVLRGVDHRVVEVFVDPVE